MLSQLRRCLVIVVEKVGVACPGLLSFSATIRIMIMLLVGQFGRRVSSVLTDIENAALVASPRQVIEQFAGDKGLASRGEANQYHQQQFGIEIRQVGAL